ncbi:MAG: hypothetical protein N2578_07990, partial [Bdellovibrionaceae bacterium]|nr:hypothetical protein [Pseudobdellovibrionaceae bacterium]
SLGLFTLIGGLFILVDFLRLRFAPLNELTLVLMGPLMRDCERNSIAGTTWLLAGVLLVAWIFPHEVTAISILFLAFADPVASFIGLKFGKDKILGGKTLQGFFGGYVACALAGFSYLYFQGQDALRSLVFAMIAALIGALAELLPVAGIDDNFTLPVFSAVGMYILFLVFGFFPVAG